MAKTDLPPLRQRVLRIIRKRTGISTWRQTTFLPHPPSGRSNAAGSPSDILGFGTSSHLASWQAPPSYAATSALEEETVTVDGRTVRPTPGMTVTVDIKTGERRVAEFLLQPVLRYAEEGF